MMDSSTSTSSSLASLPVRLLPLQLTPSGRPVLLPGEAERLIQDRADLVFVPTPEEERREQVERLKSGGGGESSSSSSLRFPRSLEDGVLRVTTHRLLWVDARAAPSSGSSCALPLAAVARAELRATRLWSSAKARVLVSVDGDGSGRLLLPSSSSSNPSSSSSPLLREIKVVAPGQAAIEAALQASLSAREWEKSGGSEGGAGAGATTASSDQQEVDDAAVAAVVQMGFSVADAVAALRATAGGDPQEAALWLLERGEEDAAVAAKGRKGRTAATAATAAASPPSSFAPAAVGVGGLLRREAASAAAADAALESAFADLGALMRAAGEMVDLARRYREQEARARDERRRQREGQAGDDVSSGADAAAAADFEDELALLGVIASPVTRAATAAAGGSSSSETASSSSSRFSSLLLGRKNADAGANADASPPGPLSLFIRELSAELSDFCQPLVAAAGGLLPLTDVYCLYNRARGAELAAPLDVVAAAEAWVVLYGDRAPLRLRRLGEGGGVLAVASADHDDAAVCELLAALARGEEKGEVGDEKAPPPPSLSLSASLLSSARARLPPAPSVRGLGRPLTPSDVAAAMRVPLPIAAAHLATAEAAGALCRDDGDEGLRHFWNFFSGGALLPSSA